MLLLTITAVSLICGILAAVFGQLWMLPVCFVGTFLGLLILAALVLLIACGVVDKEKPQEKDSKFYRRMAKWYIAAAFTLIRTKIRTEGMEQLPRDGRFLMVCNHIHDLDSGVLLHCFADSHLVFIAKREVKDLFVVGSILHKLQCQLINRESVREASKTILRCIQIIKEDQASVMVFPEGYVSLDGKLRHFRSGALKIAQKANVPVVVCTIKGTADILPNLKRLKPTTVDLHLVGVISAQEAKEKNTVDLGEQIYEMMIADMGEAYRTDEKSMHPNLQRQQAEV